VDIPQGDLSLLQHPVAQELLHARIPARVAYVARDGTPRVVPVWFHWDGHDIVIGTPTNAPKVKALRERPQVAITIDDNTFPNKVLLIRGTARLSEVQGIVPEYAMAAERYFSPEEGRAWVRQLSGTISGMVRIAITPEWVGVLDYRERFPSALTKKT
jgi:PPOX class probable F420-dependent enzyme